MERIKEILIKYKIWILAGVGFAILTTVLSLLFSGNGVLSNRRVVEKVASPYVIATQTFDIDLGEKNIIVPEEDKIFKVEGDNMEKFLIFVSRFEKDVEDADPKESVSLKIGENSYYYSPESRQMVVTSLQGLILKRPILTEDDVKYFFKEYFSIKRISIKGTEKTDDGIEYRGKFIFKNTEIGASTVEGDAFILKVDRNNGTLLNLSMLLIKDKDITQYQPLPISGIKTLIAQPTYPKYIFHTAIEQRYEDQTIFLRGTTNLSEFFVKELTKIYMFNTSTNGYILPTYKLEGDGRLVNSKGEKFWSKTKIFICAIDPSSLYKNPLDGAGPEVEPLTGNR